MCFFGSAVPFTFLFSDGTGTEPNYPQHEECEEYRLQADQLDKVRFIRLFPQLNPYSEQLVLLELLDKTKKILLTSDPFLSTPYNGYGCDSYIWDLKLDEGERIIGVKGTGPDLNKYAIYSNLQFIIGRLE